MRHIHRYIEGFTHLFFPDVCLTCSHPLLYGERTVCYRCISRLEPSRYNEYFDNEITHVFDGQVQIQYAFAGFHYHKEGLLQRLIFQLKYHHHKEIGVILGREIGYRLKDTVFENVDYLIPVPLHLKKKRKRGYNQSEHIARGIGEGLEKEVLTDVLIRKVHGVSQTRKSRMERFENMEKTFAVKAGEVLRGKHVLLIDDVVTTGSTLINCVRTLQESSQDLTVSIACLAKAD
ncbi:ComF family protein [Balneicella halophila]|uniref:ComF family protein n=1 Tax=Balneicella halophila TaxID=1537566 RepID=A0A7L4US01_BALHA|nr:ComF family protein [Balneicella halophila]PVX52201.1 ComF family protein [Balneicella halophila]